MSVALIVLLSVVLYLTCGSLTIRVFHLTTDPCRREVYDAEILLMWPLLWAVGVVWGLVVIIRWLFIPRVGGR